MDIELPFSHRQAAHCESGVAANLLTFHGCSCSEAMAFGLGEGLFFAYLPFIRLNRLPLATWRCAVGGILKKSTRRLGMHLQRDRFKDPMAAQADLDEHLERGIPVGCQTGAYWLTYFPPAFRFHFNAHNLVVYGRKGDEYLVSDPVFETPVRISREALQRARYAHGALAPKGSRYLLQPAGAPPELSTEIRRSLRAVCRAMTGTPFPLIGVRGIRFLAGRLERWPQRLGVRSAELHLGHIIRMQEEIGTGGGGFRFVYAAFLQEAAELPGFETLREFSERLTLAGDEWRTFAASGARLCKHRTDSGDQWRQLADMMRRCADMEEQLYRQLLTAIP